MFSVDVTAFQFFVFIFGYWLKMQVYNPQTQVLSGYSYKLLIENDLVFDFSKILNNLLLKTNW